MERRINLLQLLKDNADRPRSWSIKQQGQDATVYVYDVIGGLWGGVDAQQFAKDLAAIDAQNISLRINSPGGDVFDARAMATALSQHPAKVTAYIDGWAASAATTIAMAADRIEIAQGGFFMIHNAWAFAVGNKTDLLDLAAVLEKIDQGIAADYVAKTGAELSQVVDWMNAETWFTAEEAVANGFADAVMEATAKASAWNLSAYENAPKIEPKNDEAKLRESLERRLALLERCAA